ncbi:MAG: FAD-dependent monooxygenase [Gaiellaceae bacterium]
MVRASQDTAGRISFAIVGAGPYGLALAHVLARQGVRPLVLGIPMETWSARVAWNPPPAPASHSLLGRLRHPYTPLGPGWPLWPYANPASVYPALPESVRRRKAREILGPCRSLVAPRPSGISGVPPAWTPDRAVRRTRGGSSSRPARPGRHRGSGGGSRPRCNRVSRRCDAAGVARCRTSGAHHQCARGSAPLVKARVERAGAVLYRHRCDEPVRAADALRLRGRVRSATACTGHGRSTALETCPQGYGVEAAEETA